MRERWRMPRTRIQQASAGILSILFGSAGHRAKDGGSVKQLAIVAELEPERASSGWASFEAWVGAMDAVRKGRKAEFAGLRKAACQVNIKRPVGNGTSRRTAEGEVRCGRPISLPGGSCASARGCGQRGGWFPEGFRFRIERFFN